ncbi:MAG: AI-2E family transporter [Anaerolineales bacterium]
MSARERESLPRIEWTPGQAFRATVVVLAVGLGIWLLVLNRIAIFSLFVAIVISTAISPGVDWLRKRGLPRAAGVVAIYLTLLTVVLTAALFVVPVLVQQGPTIATTFAGFYTNAVTALQTSPSRVIRLLAFQLPQLAALPSGPAAGLAPLEGLTQALSYLGLIGDGLFLFLAVLLLAFYWTLDRERVLRSLLMLLPQERREELHSLLTASEEKVGAYIRGVAILCLSVGTLNLVAFLAMGMPYALLLGLAAGVFEVVPVVGPALGALPAILVALSVDPSKVIWVIAAAAVIQLLENTVLVPRVMNSTVGVHPVVSLLSLAAFGKLFGLPGGLLAIPLAAVIQLLLDRFVLSQPTNEAKAFDGRGELSVVRYAVQELTQDVRKQLREKPEAVEHTDDAVEDAIEALAADLDSLLARATAATEASAT